MKKNVAKKNLADLKKIDEMDKKTKKKKKKKITTKGKTSESSSTRKKSHSKSKEPRHKISPQAPKESGFVTRGRSQQPRSRIVRNPTTR